MWVAGYLIGTVLVMVVYTRILSSIRFHWHKIPSLYEQTEPNTTVAVLVAARNEAPHIAGCIASLLQQDYPQELLEIVVLDNHSTDATSSIAATIGGNNVSIYELAQFLPEDQTFKKEALSFGIEQCHSDWILTIDADCVAPPGWVRTMISYAKSQGKRAVVGPIMMERGDRFIEAYQQLEMAGLNVVTGGGLQGDLLINGNGANFGFARQFYQEVGGYTGNQHFVSGDDVFLLQKMWARDSGSIGYVKSRQALVLTKPVNGMAALWSQRKRWASKTGGFSHWRTQWVAWVVFLNSFMLCLHLCMIIVGGWLWLPIFLLHGMCKVIADRVMLFCGTRFLGIRIPTGVWIRSFLFQPLFLVATVFGLAWDRSFTWKGRSVQ